MGNSLLGRPISTSSDVEARRCAARCAAAYFGTAVPAGVVERTQTIGALDAARGAQRNRRRQSGDRHDKARLACIDRTSPRCTLSVGPFLALCACSVRLGHALATRCRHTQVNTDSASWPAIRPGLAALETVMAAIIGGMRRSIEGKDAVTHDTPPASHCARRHRAGGLRVSCRCDSPMPYPHGSRALAQGKSHQARCCARKGWAPTRPTA